MAGKADLLIVNAKVLTMDVSHPYAQAVAVQDGRIVAIGNGADLEGLHGPGATIIDAAGGSVTPGLIDGHLHLYSWAGYLSSVDCSPAAGISSITDIQRAITERVRTLPPGTWVRAAGYDEFSLQERRHPNRHDLDSAAPNHPVKLSHRSGMAWVLNSKALELAGIRMTTEEPLGATIDREIPSGEPSGFLLEMNEYLRRHTPGPTSKELVEGLQAVGKALRSYGVTFVQDASESNDLAVWRDLLHRRRDHTLPLDVSMMPGVQGRRTLQEQGLSFGAIEGGLHVGPVKIILSESSGRLYPSQEELHRQVSETVAAGFPVAIHAVGADAIEGAVSVLEQVAARKDTLRHRLEHVFICPPHLLERIRSAGLGVMTQPSFLYDGGERVLSYVERESVPWLYRTTALHRAGIPVAASSDAPVGPPDPRLGLYVAMSRRSRAGAVIGEPDGLALEEALALYTRQAAYLTHQEKERGVIAPGMRADLVVWDRDLQRLREPEAILEAGVILTILAGDPVPVG